MRVTTPSSGEASCTCEIAACGCGQFRARAGETLVCLLLRLDRHRRRGGWLLQTIRHLLSKREQMLRLIHRSLGNSVIELDHQVTGADPLPFGGMDRNDDTGDRRSEFRAAAGTPAFAGSASTMPYAATRAWKLVLSPSRPERRLRSRPAPLLEEEPHRSRRALQRQSPGWPTAI